MPNIPLNVRVVWLPGLEECTGKMKDSQMWFTSTHLLPYRAFWPCLFLFVKYQWIITTSQNLTMTKSSFHFIRSCSYSNLFDYLERKKMKSCPQFTSLLEIITDWFLKMKNCNSETQATEKIQWLSWTRMHDLQVLDHCSTTWAIKPRWEQRVDESQFFQWLGVFAWRHRGSVNRNTITVALNTFLLKLYLILYACFPLCADNKWLCWVLSCYLVSYLCLGHLFI